jgi:signal transduction histidine kinase
MGSEAQPEVRLLQTVTSEINATLDLDTILETVLRAMDELFGFRHSLILLLDESGKELTVAATRGYEPKPLGSKVPMGRGPIGVAAERRRIVRMSNISQQRSYLSAIRTRMEQVGRAGELQAELELPGLADAESQIAIPLQVKDHLVGVFFVESRERRVFGEREESLVGIVANHAAAAIANARLYETLEERVKERTMELERKNRELKDTQAQLFQSAKMAALGDLVAGVAHDMNSPLGAIHANAELAGRAVEIVEESFAGSAPSLQVAKALEALAQTARTTRAASERILTIVRTLRQFARLDEAERKRVDIQQGLDAALALLQHRLIGAIEVVRDYGPLPPMVVFPNRLNQAFMNLMVNAIEAMSAGGTLTIRTRQSDGDAIVEVEDTGTGIPDAYRDRIFDPGFTTKGVGIGLGLGLSIAYRIVQDHGGRIDVETAPGKGSRFTVRIPIVHA